MKLDLKSILILAGLGIGGYYLYKLYNKGSEAIDKTAGAIADLWMKLFPMGDAAQIAGNAKFPGNLLVPLSSLPIKQDENHNVFVQYAGYTWQLAPQVNGNYPATRVS